MYAPENEKRTSRSLYARSTTRALKGAVWFVSYWCLTPSQPVRLCQGDGPCGGLAVLRHAASWVRSSVSEDFFPDRGDFSLGVNMSSDSIPKKKNSFGREYKPRSSL